MQELQATEDELQPTHSNLLPTNPRRLNQDWAEQTFRYAYLMTPKDQLKKKLKEMISLALENKVEYKDIMNIVHDCTYSLDDKLKGKSS